MSEIQKRISDIVDSSDDMISRLDCVLIAVAVITEKVVDGRYQEVIGAVPLNGMSFPIIAYDLSLDHRNEILAAAKALSNKIKRKVTVCRYSAREEIKTFYPVGVE